MSIFHANEYILNLPDGLKDKSLQVFSLTEDGPSEFSVVVTRQRPEGGDTVELFAERVLTALLGRLPNFRVIERELLRLDGEPAVALEYTWLSPEGKMCQKQVITHAKALNLMLVVTATCRGDSLSGKWKAMFGELLAGFRMRRS